jgi:hypothetical protein
MLQFVNRKSTAAAIAIGIFVAGTALDAQTEAESLLATAKNLRCTFPVSVRTVWKDGAPQPTIRRSGELVVTIRDINAASGSALLVRSPINKDLTLVASEKARHFIDAGGGRVTMTVVLAEFSTGMKFKASHSIHDFTAIEVGSFRAEPEIVQYAGECEITPPAP